MLKLFIVLILIVCVRSTSIRETVKLESSTSENDKSIKIITFNDSRAVYDFMLVGINGSLSNSIKLVYDYRLITFIETGDYDNFMKIRIITPDRKSRISDDVFFIKIKSISDKSVNLFYELKFSDNLGNTIDDIKAFVAVSCVILFLFILLLIVLFDCSVCDKLGDINRKLDNQNNDNDNQNKNKNNQNNQNNNNDNKNKDKILASFSCCKKYN